MTTHTAHDADAQATAADRVRQATVALGAVAAILGAAWGSGAFGGTPIAQAADGALAADSTLLAPASPAFGIWSAIYVGLTLFAARQAAPRLGSDPRLRAIAWWVLASMVLNAVWIGVIQAGWLWASVGVIAVLVAVLALIAVRLVRIGPSSWLDAATADVTVGLYLGWAAVAAAANVAAAGSATLDAAPGDGTAVAVAVAAVVALLAIALARGLRARPALVIATGLAMAWGLAWIAAGRATGEPESLPVMWAAGIAAAVAFAAPFAALDFARRPTT